MNWKKLPPKAQGAIEDRRAETHHFMPKQSNIKNNPTAPGALIDQYITGFKEKS